MISLTDIEKVHATENSYDPILKGITLNVAEGEIFGIIGRPGAGKSSLIRCINLLERPSSGAIVIDSCNLMALDTEALRLVRRKIGMIFQHFNLMTSRTVFGNVALPLEISGATKFEIEQKVRPLLLLAGLADKANAYPQDLNAGQKQRVAIARSLVNQPRVLLCEEATAGLDSKTAQGILQLLNEINERLNLTILVMTHQIEVVRTICHRAAILNQGEIVEQGTILELFANPKSEVAKEFIKTAARLDMPASLRRRLRPHPTENTNPILRISFVGQTDQEHLIAYIIQQFDLTVNITQAHLETVRSQNIGIMIAEIMGTNENIEKAIHFLEHKNLHVEVLGYAPRTS